MAATWVPGADGSGFGVENLPYGVVRPHAGEPRPAVRVGGHALDLRALGRAGALPEAAGAFEAPDLNAFLALGRPAWSAVRARLKSLLTDRSGPAVADVVLHLAEGETLLPVSVGHYIDFYSLLDGRVHRSLLLARTSTKRRARVPPRRRAAHPDLAPPADRLPRPGRHRR